MSCTKLGCLLPITISKCRIHVKRAKLFFFFCEWHKQLIPSTPSTRPTNTHTHNTYYSQICTLTQFVRQGEEKSFFFHQQRKLYIHYKNFFLSFFFFRLFFSPLTHHLYLLPPPTPTHPFTMDKEYQEYQISDMPSFIGWACHGILKQNRTTSEFLLNSTQSLLFSTRLSIPTILAGLEYINQRFSNKEIYHLQDQEIFQILVVSFLLSNKMNDDATFTNKSWEQASGIPLSVLNREEREWLNEVKFNLAVTKYEANISVLDQCWKTWVNKYGSCHSEPPSSPTYYTPEVDAYYYSSHHHSYSSPISYLQHSYSNPYPQHQQCNYQYQYQPQYQPTYQLHTQYLVPQPPPPPPSYYDPAIVSVNYGGFIYTWE